MGRLLIAAAFLVVASGCQEIQVRKKSNRLVSTVPDLYYEQVLENIARTIAQPGSIPYFATPTQGTNQNTRQFQASYTPGWDLITSSPGLGFFGRYLLDKQAVGLQGQVQNQQSFQLAPVIDPDKLFYLQTAFRIAAGDATITNDDVDDLHDLYSYHRESSTFSEVYYYAITGTRIDAYQKLDPATQYDPWPQTRVAPWLNTADNKKRVPKNACYAANHCGVWVWVAPEATRDFSLFTLAILDIVTRLPDSGGGATRVDFAPGAIWHALIPGTEASRQAAGAPNAPKGAPLQRRIIQFPFPAPP
jgi:hypothetical protein